MATRSTVPPGLLGSLCYLLFWSIVRSAVATLWVLQYCRPRTGSIDAVDVREDNWPKSAIWSTRAIARSVSRQSRLERSWCYSQAMRFVPSRCGTRLPAYGALWIWPEDSSIQTMRRTASSDGLFPQHWRFYAYNGLLPHGQG
jgi:hypothetical protein